MNRQTGAKMTCCFVPADWLLDCVDMEEIERDWIGKPGPYGISRAEWDRLKSLMQEGDEVRPFSSPRDFWQHSAGRAGYALVRGGQAIDGTVTMVN